MSVISLFCTVTSILLLLIEIALFKLKTVIGIYLLYEILLHNVSTSLFQHNVSNDIGESSYRSSLSQLLVRATNFTTCLSAGFSSSPIHVEFMVDRVALGQVFLPSNADFLCHCHSTSAPHTLHSSGVDAMLL
jgi:hypothetical protein